MKLFLAKLFIVSGVISFCGILFSLPVDAQFVPQSVSVVATPASPSPGEAITIEAATPLFEKDTASFSWTINGRSRPDLSGPGKNIVTLTAGKVGSTITADVVVIRSAGQGGQSSISIPVSDLALTWSAETYVPKWYMGKALPIQKSIVDVIAIPNFILNGARVPAKNLIFKWSLDDETNIRTGLGEDTFRIQFSNFPKQTYHVHVVIEDTEKRIQKEGDLFLTPNSSLALIYPYSPLGGVDIRKGEGTILSSKRGFLDFIIEPFFLPITSRRDLVYNWSVDSAVVSGTADNPYLLTIDTTNEPAREILLSATTETKDLSLPKLSNNLSLFLQ